ncbi:MAG: right-handed parallel beta-helix repeat-containing protein [Bacteroidales bacterium]|nr:right-handed parallel beta-helix repeat-containing protein [Bacteroidales bacterium]
MKKIKLISIITILLSIIYSCEEKFELNTCEKLVFSCDTIKFDTLFTGIKSSLRFIKVYNNTNKNININRISLENDDKQFKLNINGLETNNAENINLMKKDSLFIFIQAELINKQENKLENNAIIFNTGGEDQKVIITAYGLNVKELDNKIDKNTILEKETNYFAKTDIIIKENVKLNIQEGTTIYFEKGKGIINYGTLIINGTKEKPVIFTGKRTENDYLNIPGQWVGITIKQTSKNNSINYANIKNAQIGIQYTENQDNNNQITISNSKIENHTHTGIYLENINTLIYNTLIANCGYSCIYIAGNSKYEIYHCTLADYWNMSYRNNSTLKCNNLNPNEKGEIINFDATIANSIIYGNHASEIDCTLPLNGEGNIKFINCLIKNKTTKNQVFESCIFNQDPEFENIDSCNYSIKENSPALNIGNKDIIENKEYLLKDYYETSRLDNNIPDAGFIELKNQNP